MMKAVVLFVLYFTLAQSEGRTLPSKADLELGKGPFTLDGAGAVQCERALRYRPRVRLLAKVETGIGLDDTFIMMAGWYHSSSYVTDPADVRSRLQYSVAEAAGAITLTSVTNVLSFGVGAVASIPAVRKFCVYTSTVVAFMFLYQITWFIACISVCGRRQVAQKHCVTLKEVPKEASAKTSTFQRLFCIGDHTTQHRISIMVERFYKPLLESPIFRHAISLAYILYLALSIAGCTQLEHKSLGHIAVVTKDSRSERGLALHDEFMEFGDQVAVIIEDLPYDFEKATALLDTIHSEFLEMDRVIQNSSVMWLSFYEQYVQLTATQNDPEQAERAHHWITDGPGKHRFEGDVVWSRDPTLHMIATVFQLGVRDMGDFMRNVEATKVFRATADRLTNEFVVTVTVFHPSFPWVDQFLTVPRETLQNVIIVASSISAVTAIFMWPHLALALLSTAAMLSIIAGVIASMVLTGVTLEPVFMLCNMVSLGLSIDLAAHVPYAFSQMAGTPAERVTKALMNVGLPMAQSAISSVIAVLLLSTVGSWVVSMLMKTIVFIMIHGLLHGLLFVPVILVSTTEALEKIRNRGKLGDSSGGISSKQKSNVSTVAATNSGEN